MPAPQAIALLKDYLEQRRLAGETHVKVTPEALAKLPQVVRRPLALPELPPEAPPPPPPPAVVAPEPVRRILSVSGATKEEKLAALRAMAEKSPTARGLGTLRDEMVFAVGNPDARLMLIGEAPGAEEERQREPFVGPAGQKLTQILKAMGLERDAVYISNICKFRPAMEDQGSKNRAPTPEEMNACLPYVLTEIDIIRPEVIVALGGTAATGLGFEGSVTRLRGSFREMDGAPVMITFHPSYLLREERMGTGTTAKRQVWEDMLQVMEKLGLPISEKQRGYFRQG
ncbi:MAG: uracil-DNA glycosylase [Verrucomicrobiaceae bacterium]|nr:uracil-DNA glycosylase [Verrucomicrobiaceae bacterium]